MKVSVLIKAVPTLTVATSFGCAFTKIHRMKSVFIPSVYSKKSYDSRNFEPDFEENSVAKAYISCDISFACKCFVGDKPWQLYCFSRLTSVETSIVKLAGITGCQSDCWLSVNENYDDSEMRIFKCKIKGPSPMVGIVLFWNKFFSLSLSCE